MGRPRPRAIIRFPIKLSLPRSNQNQKSIIPQRERYDYFLIWGHGLPYQKEIIATIRNCAQFRIVMIAKHRARSIRRLVRTIYSYDYAPFEHLRSKTKYLLKTGADVLFIFLHNRDCREAYVGEGAFRHIECEYVKKIKEELRDKWNPRTKEGRRTEDHIVHASDNQPQVDYILKYLGHPKGTDMFREIPNPVIAAPYYSPKFEAFRVKRIRMSEIYGLIITKLTKRAATLEHVKLEDTPHFVAATGNEEPYRAYYDEFGASHALDMDTSVAIEKLTALSNRLVYLEEPYATSYVFVRPKGPDQYLIIDGLHRTAILKSRGVNDLPVAIL